MPITETLCKAVAPPLLALLAIAWSSKSQAQPIDTGDPWEKSAPADAATAPAEEASPPATGSTGPTATRPKSEPKSYEWVVLADPDAAPEEDEDDGGTRLRAAVSLGGGAYLLGPFRAGFAAVHGRLGVQANDVFAFVPELNLQAGGTSEHAVVSGSLTLPIDFTVEHAFVVGFGLGPYFLSYTEPMDFDDPGGSTFAGGIAKFRLGGYPYVLFDENGARRGLVISAEASTLFPYLMVATSLSVGYEVF